MEIDKIEFYKAVSDEDNYQIFKLPDYLENYVKKIGLSELFRPLFARFVLFRYYRFQLAVNTSVYPFHRLDEENIQIPKLNDRNFDDLIGSNIDLNVILFEKDYYNIINQKFDDFDSFLNIKNKCSLNPTKIKQWFGSRLFKWPKAIKTDYSINPFTIFDFLNGTFFIPSKANSSPKETIKFDNRFWTMSLLDEFCFLIGNNSVLLKAYTEPNHRKIISSKGYLNSSKVRETSIKLIGDNMLGSITRHGGIPSHVFTDEVFLANACGKVFDHKFNKKKFITRYGKIKTYSNRNAVVGLYDQSPFTNRFRTGITRWQFLNEYIPDQKSLFKLSKTSGYDKKLHFRDPQRTFDPYIKKFNGAIIDTNNDVRTSLSEFGLFIITYDSSLPLFLVENDIPFFLFWRKEHWPFWDEELYNFLTESGLFHEKPETLNECLIAFFQHGHSYWKEKYTNAAIKYKKFLRETYVETK